MLAVAQGLYFRDATSIALRRMGNHVTSPVVMGQIGAVSITATIGAATLGAPLVAHAAPGNGPASGPSDTALAVVVKPGDTLVKISERYYGSPTHITDIAKVNGIANPDKISVGATLSLPDASIPQSPRNDETVVVVVKKGDTLGKIAKSVLGDETRFKEIADDNGIKNPNRIEIGDKLSIKLGKSGGGDGGSSVVASRPPSTAVAATARESEPVQLSIASPAAQFVWPTRGITVAGGQYGVPRGGSGAYATHTGLDLAASQGTAIVAAAGGKVTHAGPEGSYGNTVVIDHGNGYKTRYAHLLSWKVSVGASVNQGQLIGLVGSTGFSTGPHLHFELIKDGKFVNPSTVLPPLT